jgi:hypothetical protein
MSGRRQVAVIGGVKCEPGSEAALLAEEVGKRLAERMEDAPGVLQAETAREAVELVLKAL